MLDLSGLNLEKEDKNKIDLSGLGLEKEDKNEIDLSGLGLEKQKRTVTDVLESVGSKVYDGVNKIIKPATALVMPKQTQQKTKTEPILRAPTKEDDNTDGKFAVENNPDYALSAQDKINADRQGLIETDPITPLLIPGMAATTGGIITRTPAMTKLGTLIFEGFLQTKNAIVRNVKGEQYNPFEIEGVTELIPEDMPGALKFVAGLGEMVADGVLTGQVENAVKNKFIRKTADDIYNMFVKKGWSKEQANKVVSRYKNYVVERMMGRTAKSVKSELGQDLQSGRKAVAIQGEPNPIDIDEAVKINRQVNKMEIPQAPEKPLKADADINIETEPGRIETEKNIVKANNDINIETEHGRIETGEKIFNSGNIEKIIVKTRPTEYIKPTNIDKYVTKRIEENIVAARNKKEKKTSISKVSPELIADAKANGMDLTGYIHNIDTSAIRHIFKNHGNVKTEKSRGQIAITDEDIKTLPNYITKNYDYIAFGLKNDKGLDIIAYAKNMSDGSSVYMEEVRTGKKTLTTKTLYKRQTGINPDIFRRILQSSIVPSNNTGTNIIGQNGESVNNLENDAIETSNENIDTSFNPADFDEEYAKAMEEQQKLLVEEMKENGAIPTIKSEKQRLQDMGIGKILRPKKNDPMYEEYKHLSPRIQREFFYDEKDGIVNSSKGYTWDNAEHDLQKATGNDTASIWEELENVDRNVSKYEDLGLAIDGKGNDKIIKATNDIEHSVTQNEVLQKINCPITKPVDSVQITITSGVTKWSDLHKKAKAGDLKSAYELVDKIFDTNGKSASSIKKLQEKIEQLKALKEKYPNAVIVPLWSIEKAGKNKIPLAYAKKIAKITGLKPYDKIRQINKTHHTGAGAMDRIVDKAVFGGEVVPNLEYILVDDVFTLGANINELRKYIERSGGKVVATSCLGAGQGGANIGDDKNAEMLYNKFNKGAVDDYVRKNNIAGSSEELTELQARQLIRQAEQGDNTAGMGGDGQRNGRMEEGLSGGWNKVLRGRVTEKTLTELKNKFGNLLVDKFFQKENLANSAAEFTTQQISYLNKFGSLESIKAKADGVKNKLKIEESKNNSTDLSLGGKSRPSYSSALKTDVKIKNNETAKEKDFKLYQRTYDLAKKYMVGNIAESKYRPKNTLGVYYNYGSRRGNVYLNSLLS